MNGYKPGGTITAFLQQDDTGNQEQFNELAAYAAERGVQIILVTRGGPDPIDVASFVNKGLETINSAAGAINKNIGLVIETENNDRATTELDVSPADYAAYARSVLMTTYTQPNGSQVIGMLSDLNITHPGSATGITAQQWYQQVYAADPSLFSLPRALASVAYPLPPNGYNSVEGILAYQADLQIMQGLGIDTGNFQAVYILETAGLPREGWPDAPDFANQAAFLQYAVPKWANDPHIVGVNLFNALGNNQNEWVNAFRIIDENGNWQAGILAITTMIKNGVVGFSPAGFTSVDVSKMIKCEDAGKFIGYAINAEGCTRLKNKTRGTGGACKTQTEDKNQSAVTKGESFIITINKCDSAAQKITGLLKTLKLDISDNKKIADDYKDPLMRLSPYNEIKNAQKTQKRLTSKGEITFEYCQKDQYEWPQVADSNITFEMPNWVWGWAAQAQITARYLNPATDPLDQLLVDNPSSSSFLAQAPEETKVLGEQNQNTCPIQFFVSFENIRVENGQMYYAVRIDHNAPGQLGHIIINQQLNGGHDVSTEPDRAIYPGVGKYYDNGDPVVRQFLPTYPAGTDPRTIQVDLRVRAQADYQPKNGCQEFLNFNNGKSVPRPTPTPPKCVKYIPTGKSLNPFKVGCIAGSCLLTTGGDWTEKLVDLGNGLVEKIRQFACGKRELVVTPIFKLPFLDEVDRYNTNTMSIFKTVSKDAESAFEFKNSLQNSTHQDVDGVENGNQIDVDATIFGQARAKDAFDWVTKEALQPYTGN